MKKSDEIKEELSKEDNDLKALGLHTKLNRENRKELFEDVWLPKLQDETDVVIDSENSKYSIYSVVFGTIDFYPKANKVLIRKQNKWIKGNGLNWLIKHFDLKLEDRDFGVCEGEYCLRDGCKGVIEASPKDGGCSCHLSAPCDYCTKQTEYCPICNWSAEKQQMEEDELFLIEYWKKEPEITRKLDEENDKRKLFYDKFSGKIPTEKLEVMVESHTHFSMKKIGVFPKGSETYESLFEKVKGTFGGRFELLTERTFIFIAYTD